ncbi:helix-turn-helix domain-containing protein [Salinibacillus xinjiangensis]|uniref:helix-turn-helix domain-containing protein n=1 Tax=Salinibacillus xinjiangensis TaxID=1229268 RepID=UPI001E31EBAB|nr:helix-turn-helix transcriptional regulator [Salinibacillus xinjiangensis]
MPNEIGQKIKQLRKSQKRTLKQISDATNLSISFLSQLENAKSSVTLESLKKISDVLEVNPSYFFSEDDRGAQSTIQRNTSEVPGLEKNTFIYRTWVGTWIIHSLHHFW